MDGVEGAGGAVLDIEVAAVLAFQNVNVPEDCNSALEARSITRVATTPGLEESRSRVWEKVEV